MKEKKAFCVAGICAVLFLLLIVLLKTVDVAAVGPQGTNIGLSHLNAGFHELVGEHKVLYEISRYLGYLILLLGISEAFLGAYQLFTRKSLLKVDKCIVILGVIYVIMAAIYFIFNEVVINMRPMIPWDETKLESGFPSSHTILSCTIMGCFLMIVDRYINNRKLSYRLKLIGLATLALTLIGRLFSGAHWLTDILGGFLISVMLTSLYMGATRYIENKELW